MDYEERACGRLTVSVAEPQELLRFDQAMPAVWRVGCIPKGPAGMLPSAWNSHSDVGNGGSDLIDGVAFSAQALRWEQLWQPASNGEGDGQWQA